MAQSAAHALCLAEKWYAEGNYEMAALEAGRAVFFDDSIKVPGYLLLSHCYVNMGLSEAAIQNLSLAAGLEQDDSLKKEIIFQKINLHLSNLKPEYVLIELMKMSDLNSDYFNRKKVFYSAMAYFQIDDYELSKKYTHLLLKDYPKYDSIYINTLYKKALKNSIKSPVLPAISSAILPGSGQLIEGYYRDGANTFLLNACLATITVFTFTRLYPLDAILSLYPYVRRYYLSGIFNAKELSVKKQEKTKVDLYNELLDYYNHLLNE